MQDSLPCGYVFIAEYLSNLGLIYLDYDIEEGADGTEYYYLLQSFNGKQVNIDNKRYECWSKHWYSEDHPDSLIVFDLTSLF